MATIKNLTPHKLTFLNPAHVEQDPKKKTFHPAPGVETPEVIKEIEPAGNIPRVQQESIQVGEKEGIPLYETKYGDIEGLPSPEQGVLIVASGLVAAAASKMGRTDVVAPSALVRARDEKGTILGCLGLQLPS